MKRIIFAVIAIFFVIEIARESVGWALIIGAFLFYVLAHLNEGRTHKRDESNSRVRYDQADKASRYQNDLINKK